MTSSHHCDVTVKTVIDPAMEPMCIGGPAVQCSILYGKRIIFRPIDLAVTALTCGWVPITITRSSHVRMHRRDKLAAGDMHGAQ